MVTIHILCDSGRGSAPQMVVLLSSNLLQGQDLLRGNRGARVVLVVAHVDVVLGKLVPLVARDTLADLTVEHREAVVHSWGLVLLVETALRAALHIFQFLCKFHHHS